MTAELRDKLVEVEASRKRLSKAVDILMNAGFEGKKAKSQAIVGNIAKETEILNCLVAEANKLIQEA